MNGLQGNSRAMLASTWGRHLRALIVVAAMSVIPWAYASPPADASSVCPTTSYHACVTMPSGYHSSWSGAAGWVIANQRADNYYYVQFTAVFAPLNGSNTAYLDHINIDYWGWGTDRACGGQVRLASRTGYKQRIHGHAGSRQSGLTAAAGTRRDPLWRVQRPQKSGGLIPITSAHQ